MSVANSQKQHGVLSAHLSLSSFSLTLFQEILWKKEKLFPLELAIFLLSIDVFLPLYSQVKWENKVCSISAAQLNIDED